MKLLSILISINGLQGITSFQSIRAVHNHHRTCLHSTSTGAIDALRRNATFGFQRGKSVAYQNSYTYNVVANTKIRKTTFNAPLILKELREKTVKDLKLSCSRRSIRYAGFETKDDYVQAILSDMRHLERFSVSGAICPGRVTDVSAELLEEEMESDIPILLDVYATWCGPCKLVIPEFEAAARKLGKDCRVMKLDSGKYDKIASNYQVEGLPTTLLIHNGEVVNRMEGTVSRCQLLDFVEPYIQK